MSRNPDFSIVLPCFNESENIPLVVERISKFWPEINFELILVNNGSTDHSAEVISRLAANHSFISIVTVEKNIGYGHGIMSGLRSARGHVLSYSHADIQTPPEDIFKGYQLMLNGGLADNILVKGLRVNRRREEMFLTKMLARVASIGLGKKFEDINGQPKIFTRHFLGRLSNAPVDFAFDLYVMYEAALAGLTILTFPVDFGLRMHGESKWSTGILSRYKTIGRYLFSIAKLSLGRLWYHNKIMGDS